MSNLTPESRILLFLISHLTIGITLFFSLLLYLLFNDTIYTESQRAGIAGFSILYVIAFVILGFLIRYSEYQLTRLLKDLSKEGS